MMPSFERGASWPPKLARDGFTLALPVEALPAFEYDREAMIQILLNLVENSIKLGRSEPVKRITITARRRQGLVEIAVSDTGPGIPRRRLAKIFVDSVVIHGHLQGL